MAIKTELLYTKEDILRMYVSHAPFGGNVVGLEAATWRYFGKSPELLSLSESTLLAVLPNAPSYIHTGKNRGLLRNKRNKLLSTLLQNQSIDSIDYELALLEEIPPHPLALPRLAPHLLHKVFKGNPVHKPYHTSIDPDIQRLLIQTANKVQY